MDVRAEVFKRRGALLALPALVLVVFGKPSPLSIGLGVPLALAGEALRCWAVGYSGVTTRGDVVSAPQLVTAGPYAYVRNPLYVGNFLTAVGFTLAFTGGNASPERAALAVLALGIMLAVYATIVPHEEAFLRRTFGSAYDDYARRVPAVIPRLRPAQPAHGRYDASVIRHAESRTFAIFGAVLVALAVKALVA